MIKRAISILRKNSRININEIADRLKIKRSTFYDNFNNPNIYIRRFVTLVDFNKLNYLTSMFITKKDNCFLEEKNVNNLFELEQNYLVEVIFKDLSELNNFTEKYNELIIKKMPVLETVKKEEFLSG